jgi:hypothetical protein
MFDRIPSQQDEPSELVPATRLMVDPAGVEVQCQVRIWANVVGSLTSGAT